MKLEISSNQFNPDPVITVAPPDAEIIASSMKFFDKDGYELNETEKIYHIYNHVNLDEKHLYHTANHVTWIIDTDRSQKNCVLDHSMIVQRWHYQSSARDQISRLCRHKPLLNKLLNVRQKWGIDFSLDYVYDGGCFEIFHIEADYTDYVQAEDYKCAAEDLILKTDWEHGAKKLLERKSEWEDLCSDDQADWKAKYFGWDRAFNNRKVFL